MKFHIVPDSIKREYYSISSIFYIKNGAEIFPHENFRIFSFKYMLYLWLKDIKRLINKLERKIVLNFSLSNNDYNIEIIRTNNEFIINLLQNNRIVEKKPLNIDEFKIFISDFLDVTKIIVNKCQENNWLRNDFNDLFYEVKTFDISQIDKLIYLNNSTYNYEHIIKIAKKYKSFFINLVSMHYPLNNVQYNEFKSILNQDLIRQNKHIVTLPHYLDEQYFQSIFEYLDSPLYQDSLDFICENENIQSDWLIRLIEKYEDKWDWENMSFNTRIPWTTELIDKYTERWDWDSLSSNESVNWSISLIKRYKNNLTKKTLSNIINCISSDELELFLDKYSDSLDWEVISGNIRNDWTIELIEKYEDKWDWEALSWSTSFPLTDKLIDKHKDKIDWEGLGYNFNFPFSINLVEKYIDKWNWSDKDCTGITRNPNLPWSPEFISKFKNYLKWYLLSWYYELPWSTKLMFLIEHYDDKLAWSLIGSNKYVNWSKELIDKYNNKDYFIMNLSLNSNVPWTNELIKEYENKWNWNYISRNEGIIWDKNRIAMFRHKIDWEELIDNDNVIWTFDLIEKIEELDLDQIKDYILLRIYELLFEENLNDKLVNKIMREISSYP